MCSAASTTASLTCRATDTITSTITRSLGDYTSIENLTLLGSGNISATGNALSNRITGNNGANTLQVGVSSTIRTVKLA